MLSLLANVSRWSRRSSPYVHWPHSPILCKAPIIPNGSGWEKRPSRWACVSPPCISGNNRACCTRFASSTAATVSTTNNRSEEHTSELQSRLHLVCRLLLEKKKKISTSSYTKN